jgi:hypothetical protein
MRKNLLKLLSTALIAAAAMWQANAAPVGPVRTYYYPVLNPASGRTGAIVDLIGWGRFPWYPSETSYPTMMEDTTPDDDNAGHFDFGVRLRATLNPPVTGNYDFYISSDDNSLLFISTDENPANKVLIASEPQWNGHRQWLITDRRNATSPENRSTSLFPTGIPLVKGQRYYIEAIAQEGGGGNNLGVTWHVPGSAAIVNGTTLPIETVNAAGTWTNLYAPSLFLASAAQDPSGNKVAVTFSTTVASAGAANPANYTVSGGLTVSSASLMPDNRSVILTLNNAMNTLQTYTVTAANIVDDTPDANPIRFRTSASFKVLPVMDGGLRADAFGSIGGTALANLTNDTKYVNNTPDLTQIIPTFDVGQTSPDLDNFGVHITGYLVAPDTGNYTFTLNSDDASQFQLGGSADPGGKSSVIRDDGCCADRVSGTIPLVAGEAYFVEAWYKEGGGGDHLNIRWQNNVSLTTPVSIGAANLKWFATPVSVKQGPQSITVNEGTDANFSIATVGDAPFTYQWLTNGVPVPGANGPTVTFPFVLNRDNNKQVSVIVSNYVAGTPPGVGPFSVTSAPAVLTVVGDTVRPTITSAFNGAAQNEIHIGFSEGVTSVLNDPANGSPIDQNNFLVWDNADPGQTPLSIVSVSSISPSLVVLTMAAPLASDHSYTVYAQLIGDRSPSHNEINPDPSTVTVHGIVPNPDPTRNVLVERYESIDNPGWLISALKAAPKYPYSPDNVAQSATFNIPQTSPNLESFGYRARSFLVPTTTGNYQFQVGADDSAFLYLGTSPDSSTKVKIAGVDGAGCAACGYAGASANNIRLIAGQVYYIEALMVEGGGGDWLNVQWRNVSTNGTFIDIPASNLALFVDPSKSGLVLSPLPNITTNSCSLVTLSTSPTGGEGSFDLHFQWFVDGAPQTDATNRTYSTSFDSGTHTITVTGTMFGGVSVSQSCTVTAEGDSTVPKIVQARINKAFNKITIDWNTIVGAGSLDGANYFLTDSHNIAVSLSNGSVDALGKTITFDTDPTAVGETYTLHAENLVNTCGVATDQSPITFRAPYYVPGIVKIETYGNPGNAGGIGGNNVGNLVADPRYPNSPRESAYIPAVDSRIFYPNDSHETYGGRMSGYFIPPATDNYIFYTKGDDGQRFNMNINDADPSNPAGITTLIDTGDACCQNWTDRPSPSTHLTGGKKYYFESLWKEGGGGDFCQVVYKEASRSDDPNGLPIMAGSAISAIADDVDLATGAFLPQTLPTVGKLAPGTLLNRGFRAHLVQVTNGIANDTATAEALLSCSAGPNVASLPRFNAPVLNYNIPANNNGRVQPDNLFPGIPGRTGSTENMAMEALTYLDLQPGVYSFSVNSDDGFRVSPATSVLDPRNSITLGEFSGGRGSSDTIFRFRVLEAGLYPFRLIWEQGGGGGNLEFYAQGAGAVFGLINLEEGIHAFLPSAPLEVDTTAPTVVSCPTNRVVAITNGCTALVPNLLPEYIVGDCLSAVTTSQNPPAGTEFGPGTHIVTFTAIDAANNTTTTTCETTLTFVDKVAPVITTCAPTKSVAAGNDCLGVVPVMTDGVVANDGCPGIVTITQSPLVGASVPSGPQPITITATDAAGNTSTCIATLNVVPPGPTPVISFQVVGPNLQISWTSPASCWKLQGSTTLVPPTWTTIPGHSPISVPLSSGLGFFRLIAAPNP